MPQLPPHQYAPERWEGRKPEAPAAIALLSVIVAWMLPDRFVGMAGWTYFLAGPVSTWIGTAMGTRRRKIEESITATAATSSPPTPIQT